MTKEEATSRGKKKTYDGLEPSLSYWIEITSRYAEPIQADKYIPLTVAIASTNPKTVMQLHNENTGIWKYTIDPLNADILCIEFPEITYHLLIAMARGLIIVHPNWLHAVNRNRVVTYMPENYFQPGIFLCNWKNNLQEVCNAAQKRKLFDGDIFVIAPHITLFYSKLKDLIEAAGGKIKDISYEDENTTAKGRQFIVADKIPMGKFIGKYLEKNKNIVMIKHHYIIFSIFYYSISLTNNDTEKLSRKYPNFLSSAFGDLTSYDSDTDSDESLSDTDSENGDTLDLVDVIRDARKALTIGNNNKEDVNKDIVRTNIEFENNQSKPVKISEPITRGDLDCSNVEYLDCQKENNKSCENIYGAVSLVEPEKFIDETSESFGALKDVPKETEEQVKTFMKENVSITISVDNKPGQLDVPKNIMDSQSLENTEEHEEKHTKVFSAQYKTKRKIINSTILHWLDIELNESEETDKQKNKQLDGPDMYNFYENPQEKIYLANEDDDEFDVENTLESITEFTKRMVLFKH